MLTFICYIEVNFTFALVDCVRYNEDFVKSWFIKSRLCSLHQGHPTTVSSQGTLRCLEMHSKQRYKICICSVILGELESFPNYKGLSVIFPKILEVI